jgi:hypothetical protein
MKTDMAVLQLLGWAKDAISADKNRKNAVLQENFAFYAVLHCHVAQIVQILRHYDSFRAASFKAFDVNRPNQEKAISKAIDVLNAYTGRIEPLVDRIIQKIESDWRLIDSDDLELFSTMIGDRHRLHTEYPDGDNQRVPISVAINLDPIPIVRSEFLERITAKFEIKQRRLEEMQSPTSLRLFQGWLTVKKAVSGIWQQLNRKSAV